MTTKLSVTVELIFNEEDIDLNIRSDAEGITEAKEAAIAIFFKKALVAQAELAANQAVEYGQVVDALRDAQENEWND